MSTIDGLDKLFNKLDALQSYKVIQRGLEQAALRVLTTARQEAPVDDGSLRASIVKDVDLANQTATVGTPLDYAPYVEFGTGLYAANGDGRKDVPWSYQDAEGNWHTTAGQQPQPFLETALDVNKKKIRDDFKNEIKKELQK